MPRTETTDHDFREWASVLDWFTQDLFKVGPLLEGHRAAQKRVSDPAMVWLRQVALAVKTRGGQASDLSASALYDICQE